MNRRTLLLGSSCVLTGSFAGCVSRVDGHGNAQGTETLQVRFWLEEASLPASEQGSVNPIAFEDLSLQEREIVKTALEDGDYTVDQESVSPPLESLRDRVEFR